MINEHYEAVKALIPPTTKAYLYQPVLSVPPKSADYPYVILWGDLGDEVSGEPGDRTASDNVDQLTFRVRATYVGLSGTALGIVARNVRAALNRSRPVVSGWKCSRLRQSPLMEAQADLDVTIGSVHPSFAVDEYLFSSSRV